MRKLNKKLLKREGPFRKKLLIRKVQKQVHRKD